MQKSANNVFQTTLLIPHYLCGEECEANATGTPAVALSEDIVPKDVFGGICSSRTTLNSPPARKRKNIAVNLEEEFPTIGEDEWVSCCQALIVIDEIYELFFEIMITKMKESTTIYGQKSKAKKIERWHSPEMKAKKQIAKENTLRSCFQFVSTAPGTGLWIKFFKDLTCNFYSVHYNQEVTTTPESRFRKSWKYPLGGPYRRLVNKLKLKHMVVFDYFAETMLRAKMGMPKASEELIEAAVEKTFTALTSPPKIPMDEVVEVPIRTVFRLKDSRIKKRRNPYKTTKKVIVLSREKIITRHKIEKQGRRTVRELFEGTSFTPVQMSKPFFPSTSSNYINSRSKGGAVGFIQKELLSMKKELLVDFVPMEVEIRGELSRKYGSRGLVEQEILDSPPDCELNCKCSSSTLQGRTHFVNGAAVNLERFEETWKNLYWNMYKKAIDEEPLVEPVGLAEFLKVRVITKGPPLTYTVLKPFQKFLWGTLRRFLAFKLIGEVVTADYMKDILGSLAVDEEFISGDYQASTDNLHSWLTESIVDELWKVLSEQFPISQSLKDLVSKALTHHVFVRKEDDEIVERLPQMEGQLMGSIISFPFLCIANAAMCRYALELSSGSPFRLGNDRTLGPMAPIMINGDDCAIRASKNYRDIWRKVTRIGGLLESQGKTYFSSDFVVINSERFNYSVDKATNEPIYESQPYVNFGLMNGCKKGSNGEESWVEKIAAIGPRHQELMKWCPEYSWEAVNKLFLKKWRPFLKEYSFDIPWFLPQWLGGLGMRDMTNSLSLIDRKLASIVLHEYKALKPKALSKSPEWQMHERVQSRLGELDIDLSDCGHSIIMSDCPNDPRDLAEENERLYTSLVIETLFCCKNLQRDVDVITNSFNGEEYDKKLHNAISHNSYVYKKANDIMKKVVSGNSRYSNYEPLTNEELEPEKLTEFLPVYIY